MGHGWAFEARRGATARKPRRIGAAVVLVFVAMCVAATGPAASAHVQHNPRGKFLGVVPSTAGKQLRRGFAQGTPPLRYHNGPVQHSSRVYSIFWAPPGFSFPSGYVSQVETYFNDVAADSGKATNVYYSDTQYYDVVGGTKRYIAYNVKNAGAISDTAALPTTARCPNYRLGNGSVTRGCVTDAQQIAEINRVVSARGLPRGLGVEYFLFMPQQLGSCFGSSANSGCYTTDYCAYHSWFGSGAGTTLYASMPYAKTLGCDPGNTPHRTPAEAVLNVTSHEHNETITDPTGGGWYDYPDGYENGDECSFDFGAQTYNGFGYYNQVINGHQYLLQQEWSNKTSRCVQKGL